MFNNFTLHSCLNIARDKMHNSSSSSSREDIRLCRWVLLKNSVSSAMSRTVPERCPSPPRQTLSHSPQPPQDEEEIFVFPDGDIFAESFVSDNNVPLFSVVENADTASEAQWLDSLLESLADDDDGTFEHEPDDELISLSDISARSIDVSSPQISPESIFLPPSPPLSPIQVNLYRYRAPQLLSCDSPSLSDEIEGLTLADAVEDSASDTDTESVNTPDSRSMSSLNEVTTSAPMIRIVDESAHGSTLSPFPYFPLPGFATNEFSQEC
jgi:hypothetical protein